MGEKNDDLTNVCYEHIVEEKEVEGLKKKAHEIEVELLEQLLDKYPPGEEYPPRAQDWIVDMLSRIKDELELHASAIVDSLKTPDYRSEEGGFKVDTHAHSRVYRADIFNRLTMLESLSVAEKKGLAGVALTDHIGVETFFDELKAAVLCSVNNNVQLYTGAEVMIKETLYPQMALSFPGMSKTEFPEIVVIAELDDLKKLNEHIGELTNGKKLTDEYKLGFLGLISAINTLGRENYALIGAHILRFSHELCYPDTLRDISGVNLQLLDAVEICLKDFHNLFKAHEKSEELGIPLIVSSDSHMPVNFGSLYTVFDRPIENTRDLIGAIRSRSFRPPSFISRALGGGRVGNPVSLLPEYEKTILDYSAAYKDKYIKMNRYFVTLD